MHAVSPVVPALICAAELAMQMNIKQQGMVVLISAAGARDHIRLFGSKQLVFSW
jgi:hypothetical protein